MDQLICIIRRNTSYCLLQTEQLMLKFFHSPFQFDICSDVPDLLDDCVAPFLRNVLEVEFVVKGIIYTKATFLKLDRRRLLAVYVLIDVENSVFKSNDRGSWMWHSFKTLEKKAERFHFSLEDLELVRMIEGGTIISNYCTIDYKDIDKEWTEDEIVSSLSDAQNKLRLSAGYDSETFRLFKHAFVLFTFPDERMSQHQFVDFLNAMEVTDAVANSRRYFRAFDVRKAGNLQFIELVLGCCALEMQTTHGNEAGEQRCRFIFRFYAKSYDFNMAFGEFVSMIDDIVALKFGNKSTAHKDNLRATLSTHFCDPFTLNAFLQKVGSLKLRGTSILFRSRYSIQQKLREMYGVKPIITPESIEQNGELNVKKEMEEKMEVEKEKSEPTSAYVISNHLLQIGPTGAISELFNNVPCVISPSSTGLQRTVDDASQAHSDARQILRALDYFHKPYLVNGNAKKAFDWFKVDMTTLGECFLTICSAASLILKNEPRLLELEDPVYILGDIHGNMEDMFEFEQHLWPLGPDYCPARILLLGDYVDRGQFGFETVAYLLVMKVLYPDRIFLLRGNHEIRSTQKSFQFHSECIKKFGASLGEQIFETINAMCFDMFPLCAIVNKTVFCTHGGIPSPVCFPESDNLCDTVNRIPVPLDLDLNPLNLPWQLLWNDPVWEDSNPTLDSFGFGPNQARNTGFVFSSIALHNFLTKNKLSHVIRAHQVQEEGFKIRYSSKLLTVFSSSSYAGMGNNAACVLLDRGKMRLIQIGREVGKAILVPESF